MAELKILVAITLILIRRKNFKFVEIGVFKADNAVNIIRVGKKLKKNVFYVGFDLFEDKDEFFKSYPQVLAEYDIPEYPYWEFRSGQHALDNVKNKISSILSENSFILIKGDSTKTVPSNLNKIYDATVIYIDGCHEYEIVSQDWNNIVPVFKTNPDLVVVFDDILYSGVAKLKTEIEATNQYKLFRFNETQFFVVSNNMSRINKWILSIWGRRVEKSVIRSISKQT